MRGLLTDHNIQGHVRELARILTSETWRKEWADLNLEIQTLEGVGLGEDVTDDVLWQTCQQLDLALLTANRNQKGAKSLEATIRSQNTAQCLPVFTFANADRFLAERAYAERVTIKLLEYLFDIEKVRGAGRLFLP